MSLQGFGDHEWINIIFYSDLLAILKAQKYDQFGFIIIISLKPSLKDDVHSNSINKWTIEENPFGTKCINPKLMPSL